MTGIEKDVAQDYIQAVKIYELELKNCTKATIEQFTNLSTIYWLIADDYGFRKAFNISENWKDIGSYRYPLILDAGICNFPNSVELHFWKKYFQHITLDEEFTCEQCLEILEKYELKSFVPYFFINIFDSEQYKVEINTLKEICRNVQTAKNNYIRSILESHAVS